MRAFTCASRIFVSLLTVLIALFPALVDAAHQVRYGYDELSGMPLLAPCSCGNSCVCHGWYVAAVVEGQDFPGLWGPFASETATESFMALLAGSGVVQQARYCGACSCDAPPFRSAAGGSSARSEVVDSIVRSTRQSVEAPFAAALKKYEPLLAAGGSQLDPALMGYGRALYEATVLVERLQDGLEFWSALPGLDLAPVDFYSRMPAARDARTGDYYPWTAPDPSLAAMGGVTSTWGPVFPLSPAGKLLAPVLYRDAYEEWLTITVKSAVEAVNELERAGYALEMADYAVRVAEIEQSNQQQQADYEKSVLADLEAQLGGIVLQVPAQGPHPAPPPAQPPAAQPPATPAPSTPVNPPPTNAWSQYAGRYSGTYDKVDSVGWQFHMTVSLELTAAGDGLSAAWVSTGYSEGPGGTDRLGYDHSGSAMLSAALLAGNGDAARYSMSGALLLGEGQQRNCIQFLDGTVVWAWACAFPADLTKQ